MLRSHVEENTGQSISSKEISSLTRFYRLCYEKRNIVDELIKNAKQFLIKNGGGGRKTSALKLQKIEHGRGKLFP